jgi:hypothetical protein
MSAHPFFNAAFPQRSTAAQERNLFQGNFGNSIMFANEHTNIHRPPMLRDRLMNGRLAARYGSGLRSDSVSQKKILCRQAGLTHPPFSTVRKCEVRGASEQEQAWITQVSAR